MIIPGDAVTVYPSETDVVVGNNVTLYCNTTGDCDPPPVIKWYKIKERDVSVQNDMMNQLVIYATSVQQSGPYFCCVESDGTCTPSDKSNVKIKGRCKNIYIKNQDF